MIAIRMHTTLRRVGGALCQWLDWAVRTPTRLQWSCCLLYLIIGSDPGHAYPTGAKQSHSSFLLLDNEYSDTALSGNIHVRVKRSNDSAPPPKQYANAIEEFYADPNNRAMYLVLPLIVLIYGGCSSIYCIHKCCRYVKRKKLEKEMQKRERLTSDTGSCTGIEETQEKQNIESERALSPVYADSIHSNEDKALDNSPPPAYEQTRLKHEDLPLEDIEESHETQYNLQEKYKEEETSFIKTPVHVRMAETNKVQDVNRGMDYFQDDSRSSSKLSRPPTKPKTSPPPAYEKRTSPDGKSSKGKEAFDLTPRDIEDILNYYSDKKHMPDVIPDDTENVVPLRKKVKKWKHRVFNG
ncbi:uncharacterized protein LOC125658753 isoform X2 [Ostrea edulis]|uniref:uncharacterized protein LOC125658753 isoform X2 n=1 Tax=Ostrea edulis TaxID=37623 RepID=UPI0024AF78F9|nr:uncharacterized protein LOC125658753 isoform X2 [Ostrea edulis]